MSSSIEATTDGYRTVSENKFREEQRDDGGTVSRGNPNTVVPGSRLTNPN